VNQVINKFISQLSDTEKKIFYFMLPVLILALYDRLLIAPVVNASKAVENKIVQEKSLIEADLKYLLYKDKIMYESESLQKYVSDMSIPEKDINRNLLGLIERMASESNINVVKNVPADSVDQELASIYSANLDCHGKFTDMIQFMHRVNTSEELTKITRLKLDPKRGDEANVTASMTISKMFLKSTDNPQLSQSEQSI